MKFTSITIKLVALDILNFIYTSIIICNSKCLLKDLNFNRVLLRLACRRASNMKRFDSIIILIQKPAEHGCVQEFYECSDNLQKCSNIPIKIKFLLIVNNGF